MQTLICGGGKNKSERGIRKSALYGFSSVRSTVSRVSDGQGQMQGHVLIMKKQ